MLGSGAVFYFTVLPLDLVLAFGCTMLLIIILQQFNATFLMFKFKVYRIFQRIFLNLDLLKISYWLSSATTLYCQV